MGFPDFGFRSANEGKIRVFLANEARNGAEKSNIYRKVDDFSNMGSKKMQQTRQKSRNIND